MHTFLAFENKTTHNRQKYLNSARWDSDSLSRVWMNCFLTSVKVPGLLPFHFEGRLKPKGWDGVRSWSELYRDVIRRRRRQTLVRRWSQDVKLGAKWIQVLSLWQLRQFPPWASVQLVLLRCRGAFSNVHVSQTHFFQVIHSGLDFFYFFIIRFFRSMRLFVRRKTYFYSILITSDYSF